MRLLRAGRLYSDRSEHGANPDLDHIFGVGGGPDYAEVAVKTKERVQELLARLPDDCSIEDVLYHLYVIQAIERGLADADAARTISREEVAAQLRQKWVVGAAQ